MKESGFVKTKKLPPYLGILNLFNINAHVKKQWWQRNEILFSGQIMLELMMSTELCQEGEKHSPNT